jgi:hypothetical protein
VENEGMRLLGWYRRCWWDNIKMDLKEMEWEGVEWVNLAQDRDRWWAAVNTVTNLRAS